MIHIKYFYMTYINEKTEEDSSQYFYCTGQL